MCVRVCYKCTIVKAVFTKIEMGNAWNVKSLQSSLLDIQPTNSCELLFGRSTSEILAVLRADLKTTYRICLKSKWYPSVQFSMGAQHWTPSKLSIIVIYEAARCFKQIQEVTHYKTTVVWPLTSHLTKHLTQSAGAVEYINCFSAEG